MRSICFSAATKYFVLCCFFISACTSSKIVSNKAPEFTEKLSKIYLVMRSASGAKEFSYTFKTKFLKALADRGITSAYHIVDPLSLESDKQINEKIFLFNPQVIMVIAQTESQSYSGYNRSTSDNVYGGVFDIKILQPGSDAPIWRASLETHGETGIGSSVDKAVKKLVEQLIKDKMI